MIASSLSGCPVASTVSDVDVSTSTTLARNTSAISMISLRCPLGPSLTLISASSRSTAVGVELDDLDDVDELVQLLGHLLERLGGGVDDDRHPRDAVDLGRADREGLDVEPPAAEQPGDAGEHARACPRRGRTGCAWPCQTLVPLAHGARAARRRPARPPAPRAPAAALAYHSSADSMMSSLLPPAGTIGKTFSSWSTRKSTSTGVVPRRRPCRGWPRRPRALAAQADAAVGLGELHEVGDSRR
jgi:hypothetical protein